MIATSFLVPPGLMFEMFGRVAPLGLQLWDVATDAFGPDDVRVTATQLLNPNLAVTAKAARNGVFGFAHLPGLPDPIYEGLGDDAYWAALTPSDKRLYRITIIDPAQRFVPFSVQVDAPVRGLLAANHADVDVKRPAATLPLFSTAKRRAPSGTAGAQVHVNAPWWVVQARSKGTVIATGISEASGAAHLFFGYPPLDSGGLNQQVWPIQFSVLRNPEGVADADGVPDLTRLLQAKEVVAIPGVTDTPHTLKFGQQLIVIPNP